MHSLAQPICSSLQRADSSLGSAGAGIPRSRRGSPQQESLPLSRTEISMPTVARYLRKDAHWAAARRYRTITGIAASTSVNPGRTDRRSTL